MTFGASLLLAAVVTGAVDVSDRSEIRIRNSNEPIGTTFDLETNPAIGVRLRARAWALELGYGPRLTLRQVDHGALSESAHHGIFGLAFRLRHGEIALRSDGVYGHQSFSSLALAASPDPGTSVPPISQLPGTTIIDFVSSRTSLILRWAPSTRWSLTARAEYALSGGVDDVARAVIPFQHGPAGALETEYAITRLDRVLTTISLMRATFVPGPDDTLAELQIGWRHRWDRRTESTLTAGAAGLVWRPSGGERQGSAYAIAEAALSYRLPPQRIETRFSVRLAPVINWLNGLVDQRIAGNAALTWTPTPLTTVRAQVGVAQSVPLTEDAALTLVLGEAAVTLQTNRFVRLEVGTRGAWQKLRGADTAPPQWVLFVGAAFAAPTLRF